MCVSTLSFAGDVAKLTHIGGSADGKSYAYMESGIGDGLGNAYATVRIIDTASNSFVGPAFERIQTEEEMENPAIDLSTVEAEALEKAKETFKKLEIFPSQKGSVVASRKMTDLEARKLKDVSFSAYPYEAADSYKLILTESPAEPKDKNSCMYVGAGKSRKLKLELFNNQTKKTSVLQADSGIPASRGCPHKYEIEDVVLLQPNQMSEYASKVIVFIRTFSYGFEGDDVRFIAVSGSLNKL